MPTDMSQLHCAICSLIIRHFSTVLKMLTPHNHFDCLKHISISTCGWNNPGVLKIESLLTHNLLRMSSSLRLESQNEAETRVWYRGTLYNAFVIGSVGFLAPGLWNAMSSLGAGGAESPFLVNAANALVFGLSKSLSLLSLEFWNSL